MPDTTPPVDPTAATLAAMVTNERAVRLAPGAGGDLKKINYTHNAMIDLLISDPWITQTALAAHFNYSPAWISTVMGTDMFKAQLARRREELVDPTISATLEERFRGVMETSLQRLQEKLSGPNPSDNLVLKAVEVAGKAMGFGGSVSAPPATAPEVDRLASLAERLVALQTRTRQSVQVYDQEIVDVPTRQV